MKKILFLAANPKGTARLRLDEELREIETGLQLAKNRDRFILESKGADEQAELIRQVILSEAKKDPFFKHFFVQQGQQIADAMPESAIASAIREAYSQLT